MFRMLEMNDLRFRRDVKGILILGGILSRVDR